MTNDAGGLKFRLDDEGAEVEGAKRAVEVELDPADAGLDGEEPLAEQLGPVVSALVGRETDDEEGIFDLVAERGGQVVAALQLSCSEDDDALVLLGERSTAVSERELCEALLEALAAQQG